MTEDQRFEGPPDPSRLKDLDEINVSPRSIETSDPHMIFVDITERVPPQEVGREEIIGALAIRPIERAYPFSLIRL